MRGGMRKIVGGEDLACYFYPLGGEELVLPPALLRLALAGGTPSVAWWG